MPPMQDILNELNPAQREAAEHIDGPLLILAGAGTGKTKTITTRLAFLLENGVPPENTLTLTFTNKAAAEMRERALALIQNHTFPPKLFTFHKFGLYFLKFYIDRLGRNNQFVVIDYDDQKRIIKAFIPKADKNDIKGYKLTPKEIIQEISGYKNALITPEQAINDTDMLNDDKAKETAIIYERYEKYLFENNLVDFDDLLVLTYKILDKDPELAQRVSLEYSYIMVDEYQDTNTLQLKILQKLCTAHTNLCVVGDDDQSIYGWRGARIENILSFDQQFEDTKVIKLEENYRSTHEILEAANNLIAHNRDRHEKRLVSNQGSGKAVEMVEYYDEKEEAERVVSRIKALHASGVHPEEIAVLFRINALSLSLEEAMGKAQIPFELVGTIRFYERAEIKDIISYMRLMVNPHDNYSFKRIVNVPKRGIGKVTVEKLEVAAARDGRSMLDWLSVRSEVEIAAVVSKKAATTLKAFITTLASLAQKFEHGWEHFAEEFEATFQIKSTIDKDDEQFRIANIEELYGRIGEYFEYNPDRTIGDFLAEATLSSETDEMGGPKVQMMSVHAAKGLEFTHVFVIGLEEGFFPMIGEGRDLEEERRLGYVAFTRAKKELGLSYVKSRFYHGKREYMQASRFLRESGVAPDRAERTPMRTTHTETMTLSSDGFNKGDLIQHKIFGMGRVTAVEKQGRNQKLTINFGGISRKLLSSFVEKV